MRYERKYPISGLSHQAVESFLAIHPLSFSEIFPVRRVNSLYFDTPGLDMLDESLAGAAERRKVRVRWYGNFSEIRKPMLEIKTRQYDLGDKIIFPFPDSIKTPEALMEKGAEIIQELYPETWSLEPAVFVSYSRSYLGNPDAKFRVTVDRELEFRPATSFELHHSHPVQIQDVIAELKYGAEDDDLLKEFAAHFPFRAGKSSKYVKGMMLVTAN